MKKIVSEQLKSLGVPTNQLGYEYLREAIELVLKDNSYLHAITKKLYPDIAKKYGATSQRVERAIRHAIHSASIRGTKEEWEAVYLDRCKNPTNSEFIASVADYLSLNEGLGSKNI